MTAIHSPHPPVSEDPAATRAIAHASNVRDRDTYPALPWTVEELVGTQWVNVYTCDTVNIEAVDTPKPTISEGYNRIGFMQNGRLIVEHWVRWDVLPPHAQYAWYLARLARLQKDIAEQRETLNRPYMDGADRTYRKGWIKRMETRLTELMADVSAFATQHGFAFDGAAVSNAVTVQQSKPAQLELFTL